jgi:hypothetical protein
MCACAIGGALSIAGLLSLGSVAAAAHVAAPHIERPQLVEHVKRCPAGFRKSTITGNCVRIRPRWPILSWF